MSHWATEEVMVEIVRKDIDCGWESQYVPGTLNLYYYPDLSMGIKIESMFVSSWYMDLPPFWILT